MRVEVLRCCAAAAAAVAVAEALRDDVVCSEAPSQLHLALAGSPDRMAVAWTNRCVRREDARLLGDQPRMGATPERSARELDGFAVEYWPEQQPGNRSEAKAVTQLYFLSYHHAAVMEPLQPGTRYCYHVAGHPNTGSCFTTEARTAPGGFTFAQLGDMGTNRSAGTLASLTARAEQLAFAIHVGDIGYGDDLGLPRLTGKRPARYPHGPYGYEYVYDDFMERLSDVAKRVPYMVLPGNHDVSCDILTDFDCDEGQRNFSAYRVRFRMPSLESNAGAVQGMWYSFRYKNVHIAAIDTETDYPFAPTQPWKPLGGGRGGGFGHWLSWLRKDLEAARKAPGVDWILVMGHRPLYSSKLEEYPPGTHCLLDAFLEPILIEFGVDAYFAGHVHNYERTVPAHKGRRCRGTQKCPVHVINGAGGCPEGVDSAGLLHHHLRAKGVYANGHGLVHVANSTHLRWEYIVAEEGGDAPRQADIVWLHKSARDAPVEWLE